MLYISKIDSTKDIIVVTNSATNENKTYKTACFMNYIKQNHVTIGGLTYTPKLKKPKLEVTTPFIICADSLTIGSPCMISIGNSRYVQCLKLKSTENSFKFFEGNGKNGFFVIDRQTLIKRPMDYDIDVLSVDVNKLKELKKAYKEFKQLAR